MDFPHQDVNNFLVGAEDGSVYSGVRHGQRAGIADTFEGHYAFVTSLHCHRAQGQVPLPSCLLQETTRRGESPPRWTCPSSSSHPATTSR